MKLIGTISEENFNKTISNFRELSISQLENIKNAEKNKLKEVYINLLYADYEKINYAISVLSSMLNKHIEYKEVKE